MGSCNLRDIVEPTNLPCDLMSPSASPVVPRRQIGPCVPSLRFEVADGSAVRQNLHSRRLKRYRSTSIHIVQSVRMSPHSMGECPQSIRAAKLYTVLSLFLVAYRGKSIYTMATCLHLSAEKFEAFHQKPLVHAAHLSTSYRWYSRVAIQI